MNKCLAVMCLAAFSIFPSLPVYGSNNYAKALPDDIVPQPEINTLSQSQLTATNSTPGNITFDEYPVNTVITDQYESQGVTFDESFRELDNLLGIKYLSADNEDYPEPYGNGQQAAPITATFVSPVSFVEADPIYLDNGGEMIIQAFDESGTEIGSAQGAERLRVTADGIKTAVFSFVPPASHADDIAGIDNLAFSPTCDQPVLTVPYLTQGHFGQGCADCWWNIKVNGATSAMGNVGNLCPDEVPSKKVHERCTPTELASGNCSMSQIGCVITSGAMWINYWVPNATDPAKLNEWLQKNQGFSTKKGETRSALVPKIAQYARDVIGLGNVHFIPTPLFKSAETDKRINAYLCAGNPAMLRVEGGHHTVVATEYFAPAQSWLVNDPRCHPVIAYDNYTFLYRLYNGDTEPVSSDVLSRSESNFKSLSIKANELVQFLVTDPMGRRAGYDPVSGQSLNEIPDAFYDGFSQADDEDPTGEPSPTEYICDIAEPMDGSYRVTVYGPATYELSVLSYNQEGIPFAKNASGQLEGSESESFDIVYSESTGISNPVFLDDFQDGNADDWLSTNGNWEVLNGDLTATSNKKTDDISPFTGCSQCTIEAYMRTSGAGKVSLLAWYQDKRSYVELVMDEKHNKWLLKQRSGNARTKASFKSVIDANTDYHVKASYDGATFDISVNGSLIISMPQAASASGTVGLRVKGTTGSFKEVMVYSEVLEN